MGLEISQTYAHIGINRTSSKMEMHTQLPQLELHQKHASMKLETEPVLVEISQYEAFASAGLKNNIDRAKDISQQAYQQAMDYIGKVAADGDTLAAIESGGTPLADFAERDAYPEHEFGMVTLPSVGPRFNVKMGSVKIDPERNGEGIHNGVEGEYTPGSVSYNYTPSKIEVFMKQYASIDIKYTPDSKIDTYI